MCKKNIFIFLTIFSAILLDKKVLSNDFYNIKNYELSESNEKIQYEDNKRSFVRNYEDKIINDIKDKSVNSIVVDRDKIDSFKINNGYLPLFCNTGDKTFEDIMNNKIVEIFRKICDKEEEKNNFSANYDIYEYDDIISIVLKFYKKYEDKEKEILEIINFNKNSLKVLKLEDILGKDYKKSIIEDLNNKIKELKLSSILKEELERKVLEEEFKFYVENKNIVFIFNEDVEDVKLKNILKFKIPYENKKTIVLGKNRYYKVNDIDLIPLGVLVRDFGIDIKLEDSIFYLYKNKKFIAKIYLNENKYEKDNKLVKISTAPVLVNGVDLSVPFDFFEKILGVSVIKDNNEDIIMEKIDKNISIKI